MRNGSTAEGRPAGLTEKDTGMSVRSCENCRNRGCYTIMLNAGIDTGEPCDAWKPMPCKSCGGALSGTRIHNGRRYRHCFSCHFEYYEEGDAECSQDATEK